MYNTVNPPGNEKEVALFIGNLLFSNGFHVEFIPFEKNRLHLIAEKGCSTNTPAIVFSGHFDTVPLGEKKWMFEPFTGISTEGKIYGRGSSDMKGGIAAMIIAAIQSFQDGNPEGGVRIIISSGEELGCQGATQLFSTYKNPGCATGIIVGEPTANLPVTAHKGALYLENKASGLTAHSSMPHLGENAIYKIARAITKVENFNFDIDEDPLLGFPTLNVGQVSGGSNINSVPDEASFTIDVRTTNRVSNKYLLEKLKKCLGPDIKTTTLVDLPAVSSPEKHPFVQKVYRICSITANTAGYPRSVPYLTDASVLQTAFGGAPVVILGPGQPEMAHQTNEYCYTANLEQAVEIYKNILLNGAKKNV